MNHTIKYVVNGKEFDEIEDAKNYLEKSNKTTYLIIHTNPDLTEGRKAFDYAHVYPVNYFIPEANEKETKVALENLEKMVEVVVQRSHRELEGVMGSIQTMRGYKIHYAESIDTKHPYSYDAKVVEHLNNVIELRSLNFKDLASVEVQLTKILEDIL